MLGRSQLDGNGIRELETIRFLLVKVNSGMLDFLIWEQPNQRLIV